MKQSQERVRETFLACSDQPLLTITGTEKDRLGVRDIELLGQLRPAIRIIKVVMKFRVMAAAFLEKHLEPLTRGIILEKEQEHIDLPVFQISQHTEGRLRQGIDFIVSHIPTLVKRLDHGINKRDRRQKDHGLE